MAKRPRQASPAQLQRARQLRHNPTPAEAQAWNILRHRGVLGLKFKRQQVIAGFIVDFYCADRRLVLEIDGDLHRVPRQARYDSERTRRLESLGFRVARISNDKISKERLAELLSAIPPLL